MRGEPGVLGGMIKVRQGEVTLDDMTERPPVFRQ